MAVSLCELPDPISFSSGNSACNWRDFVEQLHWFLVWTESSKKSDAVKIGIMLSDVGKEACEICKTVPWASASDSMKFDKILQQQEGDSD